jgi:Uma2 family endonuclease
VGRISKVKGGILMDILKAGPEQVVISPTPIETDMTLEEFLQSDLAGYEYVKGELIPMPPTSGEHGDISMSLVLFLGSYVHENQLGRVYTSDTGFQIGDRVLMPDIAFVSAARLPEDRRTMFSIPPDLAVEIVSLTDAQFRVIEKALTYLSAGTQLVWVIEPVAKTVTVYRSETNIKTLTREDTLTGEDIIKGFSCKISQLFE